MTRRSRRSMTSQGPITSSAISTLAGEARREVLDLTLHPAAEFGTSIFVQQRGLPAVYLLLLEMVVLGQTRRHGLNLSPELQKSHSVGCPAPRRLRADPVHRLGQFTHEE